MMLETLFSMLASRLRRAVLALGASVLAGCGPATPPETLPEAVATARALVRPHVARNALSRATARSSPAPGGVSSPGPTAVVLGHRASDGSLRVGCVDSEDGAEALVRDSEDTR